jgi:hypothetical protein
MRIALTLLSALAYSTQAATLPQLSDYPIPKVAFNAMAMLSSWSNLGNVGTFDAIDVALGIDGAYAIDSSYAVWNYSTLTGAKKATWNEHGLTASKISPLITGDLAWINATSSVPYMSLLGFDLELGNSSTCATDLVVSLMTTPYIVTCTNEIWTYDTTALSWYVVAITELTSAGVHPVAISVDINENLWAVDSATNVWSQNTTSGVWTQVATSLGSAAVSDISVGVDGSVWVVRDYNSKSDIPQPWQYVSKSDSFVNFG